MAKRFRKPYRIKRKRSILRNRFFWIALLIIVITGAVFYSLFFWEKFYVKNIDVTGEEKISEEEIRLLTEKYIENRILFLKTKSIFLVNLKKAEKEILSHFFEIAEVKTESQLPDTINIIVKERSGLALWRQGERYFLLDNTGVIFEEASPETNLLKIINKQNTNLSLGQKVIAKENLDRIIDINSKLIGDLKVLIEEISILPANRLNIYTSGGWEIYFNLGENINWQLEKLNLVLNEEIPPEKRGELDYIDLRFSRIYYKYKDRDQ